MKKTFLKVSLFTLLGVAAAASFTGCKDYDGDIDSLQNQIDNLKSLVEQNKSNIDAINNKVASGCVITNVTTSADGIVISLSDGKSFTLTNGKNGTDGTNGTNGATPEIVDGYWYINGVNTGVKAEGTDGTNGTNGTNGVTPTIEIDADGYWVINGEKTNVNANGNVWTIGKNAAGDYVWFCNGNETEYPAQGPAGANGTNATVSISEDGYWVINGEKTQVKAEGTQGEEGKPGATPYIGDNGNWWINGTDTGVKAQGPAGADGATGPQGPAGATGATGATGKYYYPNEDGNFWVVDPAVGLPGTDSGISWRASAPAISVVDDGFDLTISGMLDENGNEMYPDGLKVSKAGLLRGLVFNPQLYYQGIEAMRAESFTYSILTQAAVNANSNFPTTATGNFIWNQYDAPYNTGKIYSTAPIVEAEYFMNPTNVSPEYFRKGFQMNLLEKDAIYSRASQHGFFDLALNPAPNYEKGILPIVFSYCYNGNSDNSPIESIDPDPYADSKVTVVALQATFNGENGANFDVTSDWAAIKEYNYDNIHLYCPKYNASNGSNPEKYKVNWKDGIYSDYQARNLNNYTNANGPWYTSQYTAWERVNTLTANDEPKPDLLYMVYDDPTFNVGKYVQTIVEDPDGNGAGYALDGNATDGSIEKYGFRYEFELIGYRKGNNKTSESAFAAQNPEDEMVIRPQIPTAAGLQASWGAEQNASTVGRTPMVRVTLIDTKDSHHGDQIVAVAYIPVYIRAQKPADPTKIVIEDLPVFDQVFTVGCPDNQFRFQYKWNNIQTSILNKLGISKADFDANYKAVMNSANNSFQLYAQPTIDLSATGNKLLNTYYGYVNEVVDQEQTETTVLRWDLTMTEAYPFFSNGTTTSKTIYVCYAKTGNISGVDYIFVPFTWTPKQININPTASIGFKNTNLWFYSFQKNGTWSNTDAAVNGLPKYDATIANSTESATKETEFRVNVKQPELAGARVEDFTLQVTDEFRSNEILAILDNPVYADYANQFNGTTPEAWKPVDLNYTTPTATSAEGVSGATYTLGFDAANYLFTAKRPIDGVNAYAIANYDPSNTQITYLENNYSKDILNKYRAQALAKGETVAATMIGKVNIPCNPMKSLKLNNEKFNVRFLRPINVDPVGAPNFVDASATEHTFEIGNYLNFTDWRLYNFKTYPSYYNYYQVKAVHVGYIKPRSNVAGFAGIQPVIANDASTYVDNLGYDITDYVTTDMDGSTLGVTALKEVTEKLNFYYNPAISSTGFITINSSSKNPIVGVLNYYNNGGVVGKPFQIRVPLIVEYYWGYIQLEFDVTIYPTKNNK